MLLKKLCVREYRAPNIYHIPTSTGRKTSQFHVPWDWRLLLHSPCLVPSVDIVFVYLAYISKARIYIS